MAHIRTLLIVMLSFVSLARPSHADAADLAKTYADAIEKLNASHARKPKGDEAALAEKLPSKAAKALDKLLAEDDEPETFAALVVAGEAALDLDLTGDFQRIRERLAVSPPHAGELGTALSRPRFLLRGIGVDDAYLEGFADVLDLVLRGYDDVFGFEEYSKVPGKKLRVRVHLVEKITKPPHFAPQFPHHSEVDFPVADPSGFSSPTPDGKFLFYGLCHELGHVIAMWGDRSNEEDRHVWAHYTGVTICQYVSEQNAEHPAMQDVRDARWRSLDKLREESAGTAPDTGTKEGITALFLALHDELGPDAIGAAINELDADGKAARINHVRYYSFRDLRDGLRAVRKEKATRRRIDELLG